MQPPQICKEQVLWPLVEHYLTPEIRSKIANDTPLTHAEHEIFLRAEEAFRVVSAALARFPKSGMLSTIESVKSLMDEQENRIKQHISRKTKTPRKILAYFAENIELSNLIEGADESRDVNVSGIKLKMREIACSLIDDFAAVPVRAADAVFDFFKGKQGAYDNKLSFRATVYNHYEITRGGKPEKSANPNRDLRHLTRLIPSFL